MSQVATNLGAGGIQSAGLMLIEAARQGYSNGIDGYFDLSSVTHHRDALLVALRGGHAGVAKILVDLGVDISASSLGDPGLTLQCAASAGKLDVIQDLIKQGLNLDDEDGLGGKALLLATRQGYKDIVSELLKHGVDSTARDGDGKSARDIAAQLVLERKRLAFGIGPSAETYQEIVDLLDAPPKVRLTPSPQTTVGTTFSEIIPPSDEQRRVCKQFEAQILWFTDRDYQLRMMSVDDLVYGEKLNDLEIESEQHKSFHDEWQFRSQAFRWIHLPANNKTWATDLVSRISLSHKPHIRKRTRRFVKDHFENHTAQSRGTNTSFQHSNFYIDRFFLSNNTFAPTEADRGKSSTATLQKKPETEISSSIKQNIVAERSEQQSSSELPANSGRLDEPRNIGLVLPYLDMESNKAFLDRQSNPTPLQLAYSNSAELHVAQTLDRSYYLGLEDTGRRDSDQVVLKHTNEELKQWIRMHMDDAKQTRPGAGRTQIPTQTQGDQRSKRKLTHILQTDPKSPVMEKIEQGEKGKSSAGGDPPRGPPRNDRKTRGTEDVRRDQDFETRKAPVPSLLMVNRMWLWKVDQRTIITAFPERDHKGDRSAERTLLNSLTKASKNASVTSVDQMIATLATRCVAYLHGSFRSGLEQPIFHIFSDFIAEKSDKVMNYHDKFIATLNPGKRPPDADSIKEEVLCLREIEDVRDEIHMMRSIINNQFDVIEQIRGIEKKENRVWKEKVKLGFDNLEKPWVGWELLLDDRTVDMSIKRLDRLDDDAKRVEHSLNNLLDLKQKQANIKEAISASEQANSTARQGNIIFVFTLITAVFTPLSFMTSLFSLPISNQFPQQEGQVVQGNEFTTNYVGKWFTTGELATLGPIAMWICFRERQAFHKWIKDSTKTLFRSSNKDSGSESPKSQDPAPSNKTESSDVESKARGNLTESDNSGYNGSQGEITSQMKGALQMDNGAAPKPVDDNGKKSTGVRGFVSSMMHRKAKPSSRDDVEAARKPDG